MKNYIVQNIYHLPLSFNEWFLVKAKTKKEAVNKVYERCGEDFNKKDFKAYTLEEFYEDSDVVVIH